MSGPRYTPLVESLPATVPFVGPETQERMRGRPFQARIGANESVFGPSPLAVRAMAEAAADIWQYGDPENHDLKQAIAADVGVKPDNIVIGEGIDGLLGYLVRMLVSDGTPVVTSLGAYPTFNFHVAGFGGSLQTVPYRDDHEDPEALLHLARRTQAPLIYFANPDNPMGTWHDAANVQGLIESVPDGSLLILDEAYSEFAPSEAVPAIDPSNERVIRMRTFSKAYGMAGARVGYAIAAPDLATAFNKVRNHFGVNRIAQVGALASLADEEHVPNVRAAVRESCARIAAIARANGLSTIPTATNFVAIDCGRDAAFAKSILGGLVDRGVFVRMPGVAPLNRCIRVSAGTDSDLDVFSEALPKVLADAAVSA
ncbi:MAG: pyridoxal phosphate-dependent aminotransferase [Pseudomonadota bacterium]